MYSKDNYKELAEQFSRECVKYDMEHEYPNHVGDVETVIATSLTQEEFEVKYAALIPSFGRYVLMTPEMNKPIKDFDKNNYKFDKRQMRYGILFSVDEEDFDEHHMELFYEDVADQSLTWCINRELYRAIASLPELQKRRFLMRHLFNMTLEQIAKDEGVRINAVEKSVKAAKRRLRRDLSDIYYGKIKTVHTPV